MNLPLLLPEILATVLGLGLMMWDLWLPKGRKGPLWGFAMASAVVLLGVTFLPHLTDAAASRTSALGGSFLLDPMALWFKRAFAVTALLVFAMSREYVDDLPRGQGEFYTLGLFALLGMFLCSSANDFMSLFVCLELVTVSFFVLAAFKRDNSMSVEAGLKLLVMGSLSAAILLYGIAFVYGATGTVFFDRFTDPENGEIVHEGLRTLFASGSLGLPNELVIGIIMIFVGLGFKTSAVPLHVWVPDVYQGAPTPVTAYLSVGSKLAGFVLMIRLLEVADNAAGMVPALAPFLALVAAFSLFYGNLGALPQSNIKRLMGYSSIGQCGYILLGIAAAWTTGISGALVYMAAYVFTNLAAFAVIVYTSRATGSHQIDDYAGLAKRSPILGVALTVALLSLAGVPPFIGFFGKFMLIGSAFGDPLLRWLALVGMVNVVIALYYYLTVVKRIWMREPRGDPATSPAAIVPTVSLRTKVLLGVSMAVIILTGIAPGVVTDTAVGIADSLGFQPTPR